MGNTHAMGPGLYFPIHSRRPNWNCTCQLLPRHCTARHLLRSSPLPLCSVYGGSLRHRSRLYSLIPTILRLHTSRHMNKNSLRSYVRWSQPNFLPSTFPRACRYASPILRLPRRLHPMKLCLICRITDLPSRCNHVPIYSLRSIRSQARSTLS